MKGAKKMIKEEDYVYLKCLVTAALPLGPVKISEGPIDPDVLDLIPVHSDNKVIERYKTKPLCFFVDDVILTK